MFLPVQPPATTAVAFLAICWLSVLPIRGCMHFPSLPVLQEPVPGGALRDHGLALLRLCSTSLLLNKALH